MFVIQNVLINLLNINVSSKKVLISAFLHRKLLFLHFFKEKLSFLYFFKEKFLFQGVVRTVVPVAVQGHVASVLTTCYCIKDNVWINVNRANTRMVQLYRVKVGHSINRIGRMFILHQF